MASELPRPATAFAMTGGPKKRPRRHDDAHLRFIRSLPCIVTGKGPTEAAHVRFASLAHGKHETGTAEKPDDCWAVPLSPNKHRQQHLMNERNFWRDANIDPLIVAALLFANSGDEMAGRLICRAAQHGAFPWRG